MGAVASQWLQFQQLQLDFDWTRITYSTCIHYSYSFLPSFLLSSSLWKINELHHNYLRSLRAGLNLFALFMVVYWCNACESHHSTCWKKLTQIDFRQISIFETFQWLFNVRLLLHRIHIKEMCKKLQNHLSSHPHLHSESDGNQNDL